MVEVCHGLSFQQEATSGRCRSSSRQPQDLQSHVSIQDRVEGSEDEAKSAGSQKPEVFEIDLSGDIRGSSRAVQVHDLGVEIIHVIGDTGLEDRRVEPALMRTGLDVIQVSLSAEVPTGHQPAATCC